MNEYFSPCRTEKICKGCILKRSCATKADVPNCVKQFMDGLDIKESVLKSLGAPFEQTGNSAMAATVPDCGKCIHAAVCPLAIITKTSTMWVELKACFYYKKQRHQ